MGSKLSISSALILALGCGPAPTVTSNTTVVVANSSESSSGAAAAAVADADAQAGAEAGANSDAVTAMAEATGAPNEATGTLPPEAIREVVGAHLREIRQCYENVLATNPGLAGSVEIRFMIGATGSVTHAGVSQAQALHDEVDSCIVGVFMQMQFPAPDGGPMFVTYPFTFAAD